MPTTISRHLRADGGVDLLELVALPHVVQDGAHVDLLRVRARAGVRARAHVDLLRVRARARARVRIRTRVGDRVRRSPR